MNSKSIFIFTKENPLYLIECVNSLKNVQKLYTIQIIDDSYTLESIKKNKEIAHDFQNVKYLGKNEFESFYSNKLEFRNNKYEKIGTRDWNLGFCRNYALYYSKYMNYKKVLFIDHDIIIKNGEEIVQGFSVLNRDNFVSLNIKGMPDESIIGHISKSIGIKYDETRMLSGGILYLSPQAIKKRFYNIYNEDWILQIMEETKEKITLPFNVFHKKSDPFREYKKKILFQEFGEIVVTGLLQNPKNHLSSEMFWDEVIKKRKVFLVNLEMRTKLLNQLNYYKMVSYLNMNYNNFHGSGIVEYFKQNKIESENKTYERRKYKFQKL